MQDKLKQIVKNDLQSQFQDFPKLNFTSFIIRIPPQDDFYTRVSECKDLTLVSTSQFVSLTFKLKIFNFDYKSLNKF